VLLPVLFRGAVVQVDAVAGLTGYVLEASDFADAIPGLDRYSVTAAGKLVEPVHDVYVIGKGQLPVEVVPEPPRRPRSPPPEAAHPLRPGLIGRTLEDRVRARVDKMRALLQYKLMKGAKTLLFRSF
jgi:hypothetical protein